jgi:hypothetical protein
MSNFTLPVKEAFGRYLQRFHADIVGDTKFVAEFAARDFAKSAVWAPGRMIDKVEEMLDAWRKNDTSQAAKPTPLLPIMIAAMSKDYIPVPADYSRQLADPVFVTIPGDAKNRVFSMRAVVSEIRVQVAICGPDDATCRSLALQMQLFCGAMGNRRFHSTYRLAGFDELWPVSIEAPDLAGINMPNDVKNLTMLTVDITLRATIPLLRHPKAIDANADNKGTNEQDDPDGYLTVQEVQGKAYSRTVFGLTLGVEPDPWNVP